MNAAIVALQSFVIEWITAKEIPENDWGRMRGLDFQELLRTRNSLARQLESRTCTQCSDFDDHVRYNHAFSFDAKNVLVLDNTRREDASSEYCEPENGNF
jgi:antiviral helicase SKI2